MKVLRKRLGLRIAGILAASILLLLGSTACKSKKHYTKYGPPPAETEVEPITKYGPPPDREPDMQMKYGVPHNPNDN